MSSVKPASRYLNTTRIAKSPQNIGSAVVKIQHGPLIVFLSRTVSLGVIMHTLL